MQKLATVFALTMLVVILAGVGSLCHASPPRFTPPIKISLEPVKPMLKGNPVTMNLIYEVNSKYYSMVADTGSYTVIFLDARNRQDTLSRETFPFRYDETFSGSTTIKISVPDNDTTEMRFYMQCGEIGYRIGRYFVSTGDEIEFFQYFQLPRPVDEQSIVYENPKYPDRDTLTHEQLQAEFEVLMDLSKPMDMKKAVEILGPIPDSCLFDRYKKHFRLTTTLGNLYRLADEKVGFEATTPLPWSPKYRTVEDSLLKQKAEPDTAEPQGALPVWRNPNPPDDGVSLDSVSGVNSDDKILTGDSITFYLHCKAYNGIVYGITNGFRVYSYDGAVWGDSIIADTMSVGWSNMLDGGPFYRYRSADGEDEDTVLIGLVRVYGDGMPSDFDETAFKITIGPIDGSMGGKEICLDKAILPSGGDFIWIDSDGLSYVPPWDGPYCFEIQEPLINYSGYLYYQDPHPPTTTYWPMRRVTIEMWDEDAFWSQELAMTVADNNGYFSFEEISNEDEYGFYGQDVYFLIYAENDDAYVTEDYNGDIHVIRSSNQDNLPSGTHDTTIVAPIDLNGPFFIADAIMEAHDLWYDFTYTYTGIVQVVSDSEGVGTWYSYTQNYIHIENKDVDTLGSPDTYDRDVIFHEYAHRIQDVFHFLDLGAGDHGWDEITIPSVAATEGFATFLSCLYRDDNLFRNFDEDFSDTFWVNIENGEIGVDTLTFNSANNYGASNEGAVAGALWDIYDDVDDDYSTYFMPPLPPPNDSSSDGKADTLSNGIGNILDVLLNRTVDGNHPDDIQEFWLAWFQSPSKGHPKAMRDIWCEHQLIYCGDANADLTVNLADATYIVNYTFYDGPAPDPIESGDADGNGLVNLGDAGYIINYIWYNGPVPSCP